MIAKSGVVEARGSPGSATGSSVDARAHAADDDRDRERQEEQRQRAAPARGWRPPSRASTRADRGRCRRRRARRRRPSRRRSPRRTAAKAGSATSSATTRKASTASDFASQIALRSHGASSEAVDQPLLALGDEGAREAEERGEDDRDPEHALGRERRSVRRAARSGRRRASTTTKSSIAGSVLRARSSSSEVLAGERGDVGEVPSHAKCEPVGRERARCAPDRGWRRRTQRLLRSSVELAVEQRARPPRRGALYGSSRTSSSGSCSSVRQSASRCSIPRENESARCVPCLPEPEALEQHPGALAPLRRRGRGGRRGRGSRARSARGRRAARARCSRCRPRSTRTSSSPAVGMPRGPAQSRSRVVLPEPLGPVTSKNPSRATSKLTPRRTRLSPYRFSSPARRITKPL